MEGSYLSENSFLLSKFYYESEPVKFLISKPDDLIQKTHSEGQFYETEELQIIRNYFPRGGTWCDIGANVGNHAVFAGLILGASKIFPFEPNPQVIPTLIANIMVNNLDKITDLSLLGKGLSDSPRKGLKMKVLGQSNLGSARFTDKHGVGGLEVVIGDEELKGKRVDFIKIDVEGMELRVLKGLVKTISKFKPNIFIEVDNRNAEGFHSLIKEFNYRVVEQYRRYEVNQNYMIVPV